ncbi:type IX secretion system outer membrane channel protein PorV [Crocinitomicaceae bacterium CZZ-1]|uniref:Type IX secretion system outer membrane channel protein PorV n=1 Tax=Taishania pollutisoli TaxID=2766479 RepID=A0A8J6PB69_9FLAO|nr:type IX secretion system outer membrane channel protein PorV [Taishania pollutisoli]MBC9813831.1 type IX secretion system outer membrane channel protein PorV [Taishania pollutisoli]MBX2950818.1 type IX secretion system outer membrane channel protein PorV [Crocinitomicaceae bacterium]NGF77344.1 type IX secretion system outer membrane channel protein PorV [Fluviicola sp. SGL-29]
MKNTYLGVLTVFSGLTFGVSAQNGVTQNDLDGKLGLNTITTALPFMSITPDSRAGGMGEAGTALSGSSTSLYWNTSMLIFAEDKSEISISYTPWLRNLTNDMHLSYASGYYKFGRHAVGGALRFFSLGEITYTDNNAQFIRTDKPSEFELTAGYAFKLSEKLSVGINGKFAYSNLTGGYVVEGVDTKAAIAGAADVSFTYYTQDAKIGSLDGDYTFAATINNIGNKVSYSSTQSRDFIPMNLKLANAYKMRFDKYNSLTLALEFQKLLVPTPAIYGVNSDGDRVMISGHSSDVGVIKGLVQSFYDAPGTPLVDNNGDYIQNADGSYQIKKNSKFVEELSEINIAFGMEYWYNNLLALRAGYFYEAPNKGNRQFFNFGAGLKYNRFGIDISYLAAVGGRRSPLANTLRFTLRFTLGKVGNSKADENKPE